MNATPILAILLLLAACTQTTTQTPPPPAAQNVTNQTVQEIPKYDYPFLIIFPELDQANAVIIKQENHAALIDAGTKDSAKQLITLLDDWNVTVLDALVLTNGKPYRSEGAPYVQIRKDSADFLGNGLTPESAQELQKATPIKQDSKKAVGAATLTFLVPYDSGHGYSLTSEDNSLMTVVEYGTTRFLLMSDCTEECVNRINTSIRADVLMVPKSGCAGSISLDLIKKVRPTIAIIQDSQPGCPDQSVLDMLDLVSIKTYLTSKGQIILYSDGTTIHVQGGD